MMKGCSVFAKRMIRRGGKICNYTGEVCTYSMFKERHNYYNKSGSGSYILEFKYKEKCWAIDATKEDNSFSHLINHSKKLKMSSQ